MDIKLKIVFLLAVTTVNAGFIAVAPKILEGPSSRTVLVGPDGSQISAIIPGGRIVLEGGHGPLLQGAPEVVAIASVAQPVPIAATLPVGTEIVSDSVVPAVGIATVSSETKTDEETVSIESAEGAVAAKSAPVTNVEETEAKVEAVSATDTAVSTEGPQEEKVTNEESVQIAENSSTNSTTQETSPETPVSVATPTNAQEVVAVKSIETPVVLSYLQDSPLFVSEDSDSEGQYVADNLEKQFDDGSYKPNEYL